MRAFGRNPGFTLAALLSLAIGMGAESVARFGNRAGWSSTAQYFDIKNASHAFEQVGNVIGHIQEA